MSELFLSPYTLFTLLGIIGCAGVGALIFDRTRRGARYAHAIAHGGTASALVLLLLFSGAVLMQGTGLAVTAPGSLFPGLLALRVDGLTAVYLLLLGGVGLLMAFISGGVSRRGTETRSVGALGLCYAVFLGAHVLFFLADSWSLLLFSLSIQTVSGYFLITADKGNERARRLGLRWFLWRHLALYFLLVAFLLMSARAGSPLWSVWRATEVFFGEHGGLAVEVVFLLGVVSFSSLWTPRDVSRVLALLPTSLFAPFLFSMLGGGSYLALRFFSDLSSHAVRPSGIGFMIAGVGALIGGTLTAHALSLPREKIAALGFVVLGFFSLLLGGALRMARADLADYFVFALSVLLLHAVVGILTLTLLSVLSWGEEQSRHVRFGRPGLFLLAAGTVLLLPPFPSFITLWSIFQITLLGLTLEPNSIRFVWLGSFTLAMIALGAGALVLRDLFGQGGERPTPNERPIEERIPTFLAPLLLGGILLCCSFFGDHILAVMIGIFVSHTYGAEGALQFPFLRYLELARDIGGVIPLRSLFGFFLMAFAFLGVIAALFLPRRRVARSGPRESESFLAARAEESRERGLGSVCKDLFPAMRTPILFLGRRWGDILVRLPVFVSRQRSPEVMALRAAEWCGTMCIRIFLNQGREVLAWAILGVAGLVLIMLTPALWK